MFPQSSAFHTPDNANDRIRSQMGHSASQSSLHASFSVGGTHHPHGTSSWASNSQSNTLPNSLNDPFLQSRSSYQSGYLRFDDMPLVQTKAKLNSTLSRAPTSEFGKDPMFESSRWAFPSLLFNYANLVSCVKTTSNIRRGCSSYRVRQ